MRKWLLAALLTVPLVDAAVLVYVGTEIGWPATVLLVVLTALLGTVLVQMEGRRTLATIQRSLAAGEPPTDSLLDGGLIIAAGAFLLTPGLVTDAIGFLLVVPLTRIPIRRVLKSRVIVPKLDEKAQGFATGNVYAFGFPQSDSPDGVDPSDFDLGGRMGSDGGSGSGGSSGAGGTGSGSGDDTVDLGSDEYDVSDDER